MGLEIDEADGLFESVYLDIMATVIVCCDSSSHIGCNLLLYHSVISYLI